MQPLNLPLNLSLNIPLTDNCNDCNCCFPMVKSKPIDIPDKKIQHQQLMAEIIKKALFFRSKEKQSTKKQIMLL